MDQTILIADEVAEMLRVDRQRVYELVRQHKIPVIRVGERQYRFNAEAIARWMERGGTFENGDNPVTAKALDANRSVV